MFRSILREWRFYPLAAKARKMAAANFAEGTMGLFGKLLGDGDEDKPRTSSKMLPIEMPPLVFIEGATLPIVDWKAMDPAVPPTVDKAVLDAFWTALARKWLEALGAALGKDYAVRDSERFLLLGALDSRGAQVVLESAERARKDILMVLEGIARDSETGKVCVLVLDGEDRYYQYISNYDDPGEHSLSGGMFIQRGYGHFVFAASEIDSMEPTIAHELTHCLMQHLPLPAWLNEGIAVNTEHKLRPPGRPLYTPEEMQEKHLAYWNESTMQEFWSGKSWGRPEGNMLSYDLARNFVLLASEDYGEFRGFVNAANAEDSGDAAAKKYLDLPVANLAEAVLGEGLWAPKPETWTDGIERGQFRTDA
jgi:hypothetical protein